jgi:hypothetical protein
VWRVRSGRTAACRCPGAPLICARYAGASLARAAWVQQRLSWDAEVGVLVWVLMARAGPAQRLNAPGRSVHRAAMIAKHNDTNPRATLSNPYTNKQHIPLSAFGARKKQ